MNILILSPEPPYPPVSGGRLRVFNVMKELARNNNVFLITFVDKEEELKYRPELLDYCKDVALLSRNHTVFTKINSRLQALLNKKKTIMLSRFYSPVFQQKINEFMAKYDIDIVQLEHSYIDVYEIPVYTGRKPAKVLVQHNLEYKLIEQQAGARWPGTSLRRKIEGYIDLGRFKEFEINAMKRAGLCVMMSNDDRNQLAELVPEVLSKTIVVPNGVDVEYFQYYSGPRDECTLVFSGFMGHFPNEDGILWFFHKVFPYIKKQYPRIKVFVVGRGPSKRIRNLENKYSQVTVTGFVDDVREYLNRGTVFICPLRMGSGTRLKILEAMSAGIPVVTTSIGCEGLQVEDGQHLLIADSEEGFATKVNQLLEDGSFRTKLSKTARSLVEDRYSWPSIVAEYEKELQQLVKG